MENNVLLGVDELEERITTAVEKALATFFANLDLQVVREDSVTLTLEELCKRWHISVSTLYNYQRLGIIKPICVGDRKVFTLEDVKRAEKGLPKGNEKEPKLISLDDIGLSTLGLNILKSKGINTVYDLFQYCPTDLFRFRGFGKKSYAEVMAAIKELGLEERWWSRQDTSDTETDALQERASNDNLNIDALGLTYKVKEILNSNGIYTLHELLQYSQNDLLKLEGLGKNYVSDIEYACKDKGLSLRANFPGDNKLISKYKLCNRWGISWYQLKRKIRDGEINLNPIRMKGRKLDGCLVAFSLEEIIKIEEGLHEQDEP